MKMKKIFVLSIVVLFLAVGSPAMAGGYHGHYHGGFGYGFETGLGYMAAAAATGIVLGTVNAIFNPQPRVYAPQPIYVQPAPCYQTIFVPVYDQWGRYIGNMPQSVPCR